MCDRYYGHFTVNCHGEGRVCMARTMKLLVVANPGIDSDEIRDAIVQRAAEGPVQVTLVAPAAVGAGPMATPPGTAADRVVQARHAATVSRLERAVAQLRDAGVQVEGVVGGRPDGSGVTGTWDPARFDEVVVSCRPWLSLRRSGGRWIPPDVDRPAGAAPQ
jgi:hypothetical protein